MIGASGPCALSSAISESLLKLEGGMVFWYPVPVKPLCGSSVSLSCATLGALPVFLLEVDRCFCATGGEGTGFFFWNGNHDGKIIRTVEGSS